MPEKTETITLYASGSIPGIPGVHAPGTYTVDYVDRTLKPIMPSADIATEVAQLEQEIQNLTAEQQQQA